MLVGVGDRVGRGLELLPELGGIGICDSGYVNCSQGVEFEVEEKDTTTELIF